MLQAQYEVGLMYANGSGTDIDLEQAAHWIGRAAERGVAAAQYLLGTRYAAGVATARDEPAAFGWFQRAAEQGHVKARWRLGRLIEQAPLALARAAYLQAAEAGLAEAQHAGGQALAQGLGGPRDEAAAAAWWQRAAEQGFAPAQQALATCAGRRPRDRARHPQAAQRWYDAAARQGLPAARVALQSLEPARKGRSRRPADDGADAADAAPWIRNADTGDADAQYHLALMYETGLELPVDLRQAETWYLAAARQGDVRAQRALARLYAERDPAAALHWTREAAAQGELEAQFALGRHYSGAAADQADHLQGLSWYLRAAEQGDARALLTLGHLFQGGTEHLVAAAWQRAAEQGGAQAQYLLGQLHAEGRGVAQDLREAAAWYARAAQTGPCAGAGRIGRGLPARRRCPGGSRHGAGVVPACGGTRRRVGPVEPGRVVRRRPGRAPRLAAGLRLVPQGGRPGLRGGPGHARPVVCAHRGTGPGCCMVATRGGPRTMRRPASTWRRCWRAEKASRRPDPAQAFHWFAAAAERGLPAAQSRLGLLYATGQGVVADPIEAHKWFAIAATADAAARDNLLRSQDRLPAAAAAEGLRRAQGWDSPVISHGGICHGISVKSCQNS